jgi:hypothetical protein
MVPIDNVTAHAGVGVGAAADADAWLNVTVCPATLKVPLRSAPAFASTVNVNVPVPVPLALAGTWIHDVGLVAVQLHAVAGVVVTVSANDPPVALPLMVAPVDSANVHAEDGLVELGVELFPHPTVAASNKVARRDVLDTFSSLMPAGCKPSAFHLSLPSIDLIL